MIHLFPLDIRRSILIRDLKSGRIKTMQDFLEMVQFLGLEDCLKKRLIRTNKINRDNMSQNNTYIITGGDSK